MQNVKKLREITGAGILDCQKALKESNDNLDLAMDILRKKGLSKAASKSDRRASEGYLALYIDQTMKHCALVELNCETDFVSRNNDFKNVAIDLAKHYSSSDAKDLSSFKERHIGQVLVDEYIKGLVLKFGENILMDFADKKVTKHSFEGYVHTNGKIAVVIEFSGDNKEVARDISMHVAAMAPASLDARSVDKALVDKEKEIYRLELQASGKPEAVIEKIIEGKVSKYLESICLLNQKFVKNSDLSVEEYIKNKIEIVSFKRYVLGEN